MGWRAANCDDRPGPSTSPPSAIRSKPEIPVSTFSIDVDTASYSNVRRMLNAGRLPPRDAVRIEELVNYFRYDYPLPQNRSQPFSANATVAPSPWAEGRQLVHVGLQGYNIVPRERPPLNLTLLLDVSGSMGEPNKLPLVKDALRMLVRTCVPDSSASLTFSAVQLASDWGSVPVAARNARPRSSLTRNLYAAFAASAVAGLAAGPVFLSGEPAEEVVEKLKHGHS